MRLVLQLEVDDPILVRKILGLVLGGPEEEKVGLEGWEPRPAHVEVREHDQAVVITVERWGKRKNIELRKDALNLVLRGKVKQAIEKSYSGIKPSTLNIYASIIRTSLRQRPDVLYKLRKIYERYMEGKENEIRDYLSRVRLMELQAMREG